MTPLVPGVLSYDWMNAQVPVEKLRFFSFVDERLLSWKAFPRKAYMDKVSWREVVPMPGEIIGVATSIIEDLSM